MRFTLPTPPSVNNLFATYGQRRVTTERYLRWRGEADKLVMIQREGQALIAPPVAVIITLPRERRKRDIDNFNKAILDCLVRMHILPDDSDIIVTDLYTRVRPQLECTVEIMPAHEMQLTQSLPLMGRVS